MQALEGQDIKELLVNVGSGGGAAAPAAGGASGEAAAAPEEEKKEEGMLIPETTVLPHPRLVST